MVATNSRSRIKPDLSRQARPYVFVVFGAFLGALVIAGPASAEDRWWEEIVGFGNNDGYEPPSAADRAARRKANAALEEKLKTGTVLLSYKTLTSLHNAVQRYQGIVAKGGWPQIPGRRALRVGDRDERVTRVRRRLLVSGDRVPSRATAYYFDTVLQRAVKRFQMRHGIRPSGVVDRRTLIALNVPAATRLRQLRINYVRLRQALAEITEPGRFVTVNVPSFELQAVENGAVQIYSRVIVGKPDRQTPGLKAKIRALNFYPYWRVPDSIAHRDVIPQLLKSPTYLEKERIRVLKGWGQEEVDKDSIDWHSSKALSYKFRQDPGEFNALGVVRIDMPNEHTVYLHDTPLKPLFGRNLRAYSAGCVRVQKVIDLASWLVRDEPGWDRGRIDAILAAGVSEDVKFKQTVPVYFLYLTAWATGEGTAYFRRDIYDRDGTKTKIAHEEGEAPQKTLTP